MYNYFSFATDSKYKPIITKYIYRLTFNFDIAEDITQEAFENLLKHNIPYTEEKGDFGIYLCIIAKNLYLKKRKRDKENFVYDLDVRSMVHIKKNEVDPGIILERETVEATIREIILELPEPEKAILLQKYFQKKSLKEISQSVKLSERTVSRKLLNAYDILRLAPEKREMTP